MIQWSRFTSQGFLLLFAYCWAHVAAIQQFCQPETANLFCSFVPTVGGVPDYNGPGEDPTKPWVIGQQTVVQLTSGHYEPGGVDGVGDHIIFVIEEGTLAIEDIPDDEEVSIAANIFICDQASFIVKDSFFRSAGNFFFNYLIVSSGTSSMFFQGAKLSFISTELEQINPQVHGAALMMVRDQSTLTVTPSLDPTHPYGITGDRPIYDVWEIAVLEDAVAEVITAFIFGEYYIASNAVFNVTGSLFFDVFFEICPGDEYSLTELPQLCSAHGDPGMEPCLTEEQPELTWSVGPPDTSFTMNLSGVKVFAMSLSTYVGSSIQMGTVSKFTNLNIGVNVDTYNGEDTFDLVLQVGLDPFISGLDSTGRTLEFSPTTYIDGWHLWPETGSNINLNDSEVGDFNIPIDSIGTARDTFFYCCQMQVKGEVDLWSCTVNSNAQVFEQAYLRATNTTFIGPAIPVEGVLSVADSSFVNPPLITNNGRVIQVEITSPSEMDSNFNRVEVQILGTLLETNSSGSVVPKGYLDLVNDDTGITEFQFPLEGSKENELLATVDMSELSGTSYRLELYAAGDGISVSSTRYFTVSTTTATTTTTSNEESTETGDQENSSTITQISSMFFFFFFFGVLIC